MKKIIVIGANGFAGRRILDNLSTYSYYSLIGISLHPDIRETGRHQFYISNLTDYQTIDRIIKEIQPKIVINCSALSAPDYCEQHHEETFALNVAAVEHLAQCCEQCGCRLIHLSSDFVFDGNTDRLYTEEDLPAPINYYGLSKYLSEIIIAKTCSSYAIVRVVVVYGKNLQGQHGNIVQLVKNRLESRQEIKVVSDQYRTPTWVQDIAEGTKLLLDSKSGIYHICGKEYMSIKDIAYRTAAFFHLDSSLILPVTTAEMHETTPRPFNSGLNIEKAIKELGYQPHSFEEGLEEIK
ncbi:MAG: SDR family oxidoreductase [Parabacteroides sp.]|nr:SDR family oxidoreductase [Parabacteroides sp.]